MENVIALGSLAIVLGIVGLALTLNRCAEKIASAIRDRAPPQPSRQEKSK